MQQQQPGPGHDGQQVEATSRLCVKNIPKHLTEQRLKEHFSAKGQVTDVKILKTRDGHSRQMAFVGYRSVEDSSAAMKYFQNTYVDTSRLSIEYARRYRAPATAAADASAASAAAAADKQHRPWSKYSEGSSKHQQLLAKQAAAVAAAAAAAAAGNDPKAAAKAARAAAKAAKAAKKAANGQLDEAAQADPKLAEFLQLMQPRSKARIWGNDELLPEQDVAAGKAGAAAGAGAMAVDADDEADELYVDLADLKPPQQQQPGRHKAAAAAVAGRQQQQHPEARETEEEDGEEQEDEDLLASKDAVVVDDGVSDLDYMKARMRKSLPDAQQQQQQQQGSSSDDEMSSSSSEGEDEDAADTAAGDGDEDVDMLGSKEAGKQREANEDADAEEDEAEGDQFDAAATAAIGGHVHAAAAGAAEAEVLETGRLFVRNLAYSAGEAELSQLFGGFGDLEAVHLVLDRETKRSRGIAYVKYVMPEDALAAYRALDMSPFQGRLLHVLPAKRQPGEDQQQQQQHEDEDGKPGSSSFKGQREAQRKGDAGNRAAWSSLFMRADTVAAAVAAHYGVSKAQLLDATAADLPLRMALGEAQVIAQTKAALLDGGINVSALEAAAAASGKASAKASVARSATTLLVKNLPYSSDNEELRMLFAGPGGSRSVVRLVLPPTRTLALVEFGEPQDARSAFKALAYKKYQQVPLYLEWAPRDIWDSPAPPAAAAAAAGKAAAESTAAAAGDSKAAAVSSADTVAAAAAGTNAAAAAAAEDEADEDGSEAPVACIYVKNLNFATGDAALRKHFDKAVSAAGGSIHSAKVARRKAPDGKLLSMGFGFVETDSEAAAKAAIKALQGSMLEKHKLQLQLSKHGAPGAAAAGAASKKAAAAKAAAAKAAGTKLVVRNVAFEATRKDLMGLFGPFGHIKSCRLPKKFDGNHRGFAFLEFTTKQEAQNALEGVGGTHLYGRRLVVEYAQADDESAGLDELRAKTAAKFAAGQEEEQQEAPAPKRLKRNL